MPLPEFRNVQSLFFLIPVVLLALLSLDSCATLQSGAKKGGWYEDAERNSTYRMYFLEETIPLIPELRARSPKLDFSVNLLDIQSGAVQTLLNKTLYDGMTCRRYAEERFAAIKKKYNDVYPSGGALESAPLQWEYHETGTGTLYHKGILVIERFRSMYDGGAHGMQEKEFFVLDTHALNRLRFSELFMPAAMNELKKIMETTLKKTFAERLGMSAKPETSLQMLGFFENSIEIPAENFFVTPAGLGFAWNPYQVAPYSYGIIEVELPYQNIHHLLSEKGRAVWNRIHKK
ncbi:MAG: RsiV family protein [Spirochaetaceae bacterium]|jgi:hypothetical protein|nr:RsiV family protein [Spirochaetaceae bacterium]